MFLGAIMSEITKVMTSKVYLEVCISIEGICADIYHYYSEIYVDFV